MKKSYFLITLFAVCGTIVLNAQNRIVQIMKDGNVLHEYPVEQIDSIIIVEKTNDTPLDIEAVDLGLSVKWASCNVGATSPEEYGGYYAWGETEEKDDYTPFTYKYYLGDLNGNGYHYDSEEYLSIGVNICGTSYDVAHVKWGGNWRMPTREEFEELCEKCIWEWTVINGVNGKKATGPNGNSIFIPVAGHRLGLDLISCGVYGYYWSGTLSGEAYYAFGPVFEAPGWVWSGGYRDIGKNIRPVTEY